VICDKLVMWKSRSFLRKWWQRLILRLGCEWACVSQSVSRVVGDSRKLSWWFRICIPATCFNKYSVQEMGDLTHAYLVILGIFCTPLFFAKM
jgi:hypothetical protein